MKNLIAIAAILLAFALPSVGKGSTGTVNITPIYLSFGYQAVGIVSAPKTITVTNNTQGTFAITSVAAETGFSVANTDCSILAPTQSCTAEVVFAPQAAGNYVKRLLFSTTLSPSPLTAVLYGTGQ